MSENNRRVKRRETESMCEALCVVAFIINSESFVVRETSAVKLSLVPLVKISEIWVSIL